MKGKPCGLYALLMKKAKQKEFFKERRKAMAEENLANLGPLENVPKKKKGPLTTAEKETIVRMVHIEETENGRKRSKAIKGDNIS